MKKIFYPPFIFVSFFSFAFILSQNLRAQWSQDPAVNTMVCGAAKDQTTPAVVSAGAGGVIIAWRDYRYTESIFGGEIIAQKLDSAGIVRWTEDGLQVNASALSSGHFRPQMTQDIDSGAIVVWNKGPLSFYDFDIHAQRLDPRGEKKWAVNDVVISNAAGTESFHKVVSDHRGGALIVWQLLPGGSNEYDIYAQRVDSTGSVLWKENGVAVCVATQSQMNPALAWDGHGGAIIVWGDSRAGLGVVNIFVQRIDSSGKAAWQGNGLEISSFADRQGVGDIISDGVGGAIIVYTYVGESGAGLYAQRINGDGERLWGDNGVKLCSACTDPLTCDAVTDETGGVIVVWQDARGGTKDIYAQRLSAVGEVLWTNDGVPLSVSSSDQLAPVAVADGAGGAIVIWQDKRTDAWGDLYAQRINGLGIPQWQINGIAVCTAQGEQSSPVPATDGKKGAIFVWQDKRNGNDFDIYAQRVDKNGHFGERQDSDNDGVPDVNEQGPQGGETDYDGNGDGTADRTQGNVASFYTYDRQHYVTLAVPDSVVLNNVGATGNPFPDAPGIPGGGSVPFGFFSFSITGLTAGSRTVAMLFLDNDPLVNHYYKYGPVSGQEGAWYDFTWDGETGAQIHQDTVLLYLTDGKRGDYDLTANGIITDPGAPLRIATYVEPNRQEFFYLKSIRPNPVRERAILDFINPEPCHVRIQLFDITGKEVSLLLDEFLPAGEHRLTWHRGNVPQGIFLLKITAGDRFVVGKVMVE